VFPAYSLYSNFYNSQMFQPSYGGGYSGGY
jgi:hypothetical protein